MNTIYTYGNGDFILTVLTSVNFFMQNAMGFFKVAALLSLLTFAVQSTGVLPSRGYDWVRFIRSYVLIGVFVLTPYPGAVTIKDIITNDNYVFNFKNNKLPFGLIAPIAITSGIMYNLIQLYQQRFEIDKNLNYTYSGMNFGANFILGLDSADSHDDKFNINFSNYMQHCAFPILNKNGALSQLRNSSDIFATLLQYTSAARFVQQVDWVNGTNTIVMSCSQAINEINNYYENNKDTILRANASMMGFSTASGFDRFLSAGNATAETLLQISQGASAALKQAIGMNMIMASLKAGAQTTGNGSLALAAYDTEQFQQYKTTSALAGAALARTTPVLVAVTFALLFLLYPIMVFLAIMMGSYRAIGIFLQIIVTINLIPLIYEILNYISTYSLQNKLGTTIVGQAYTYQISASLYSFTDNLIIAGNYLAGLSPVIAFSIVTGSSFALTTVFSHVNDPAKQSANALGQEYARGNQTIGNTTMDTHSFNNINSNKFDDQVSMNTGVPIMKQTTPGGVNTNVGGHNFAVNYRNDLLTKPNFAALETSSLENSLRHNQDQMGQISNQWNNQASRVHDLSNSIASGEQSTNTIGADDAKNLRQAQALSTQIAGNVAVSKNLPFISVNGSAGITSSSKDDLDHTMSEYYRVAKSLSNSSNKEVRDLFSNSKSMVDTTSHTMQEMVSKSQALSDVMSNQSAINTDLSNDFGNYIVSSGQDPLKLSAGQQHAMAQKFVHEKIHSQYGINTNLDTPSSKLTMNASPAPQINDQGISQPDQLVPDNLANKYRAEVQASIDDFKNYQGNVIGNQVKEQTKTVYHAGKDLAMGLKEIINRNKK